MVGHPSGRKRNVPNHHIAQADIHRMLGPVEILPVMEPFVAFQEALESSPGSLLIFASSIQSDSPITSVHLKVTRGKQPGGIFSGLLVKLDLEQIRIDA